MSRGILASALAAVMLFVAACGHNAIGPSEDKVRLDIEELLRKRYYGAVALADFSVDKRETLAEDRVEFRLTLTYELNRQRFDRLHGLKKMLAQASVKQPEQLLLLYRLQGSGLWKIARVQGLKPDSG